MKPKLSSLALVWPCVLSACGTDAKPSAALVVRVLGADKTPYRYESRVVVNWFASTTTLNRIERELPRGTSEATFEGQLGIRASVTVFAADRWLDPVEITALTKEAPRQVCTLVITHEPIRVRARIALADSKDPLPGKLAVRARKRAMPRTALLSPPTDITSSDPFEAAVSEAGALQIDLPNTLAERNYDQLEIGWRDWRAIVVRATPIGLGEIDLGELRLRKPAELATGTVVDSAKKPVLGSAFALRDADTGDSIDQRDLTVTKQERGRFTIKGWTAAKRLELQVGHEEHAPGPWVGFTPGARDLEVVLSPGGTIVLSARSSRAEIPGTLELWLEPAGTKAVVLATTAVREPDRHLKVVWRGLAPGTYSILGRTSQEHPARELVKSVTAAPKSPSNDPRLGDLDLTDLLEAK